jgi:hypothetical protein
VQTLRAARGSRNLEESLDSDASDASGQGKQWGKGSKGEAKGGHTASRMTGSAAGALSGAAAILARSKGG